MRAEILRIENILKGFSGNIALSDVNISLLQGEILGLVGGNGTGKTTLVEILSGLCTIDKGTIFLNEKKVEISSLSNSQRMGIFCIHQESSLINNFSVEENLAMYNDFNYSPFQKSPMKYESIDILNMVGLDIDPGILVQNLSYAQKRMVEIARIMMKNPKLLVLDEITLTFTNAEFSIFKNAINKLREQGVSIIFISHSLEKVMDIADKITVLRNGEIAGTVYRDEFCKRKLFKMMLMGENEAKFEMQDLKIGDEVFKVEDISTRNVLNKISFNLRKGEILGIIGLDRYELSELASVLFGYVEIISGNFFIKSQKVIIRSPRDALQNHIGLITFDSEGETFFPNLSVEQNIVACVIDKFSQKGLTNPDMQKFATNDMIKKMSIKATDFKQSAQELSYGNIRKIAISRLMAINPEIIIMNEPTNGLDEVTKKDIYSMIDEIRQKGVSVIILSVDLYECLSISDRIMILHKGKIKGELSKEEVTEEKIINMMID